ncbi:apolipoprotein N-acyltransferase [Blastopirellula marina]|uniref:Apolipoprotein N-acyltransferase n=1 Tax=Blastopirellula marina TaxID=124 RepID=A0A2S8FLD1_9BACT|nr:apolipoprotein N-acyltransferase [Blastopirellula marina]PQO32976.1 apolipoprotein N-acyltransferase [Blastopirellula marina]PTL43143.1 apolipoprotein N-acyltransferase [Blastopirellula marina]
MKLVASLLSVPQSDPQPSPISSPLTWRGVLLFGMASALLLALAFPKPNLTFLAWVAPIGWLLLVRAEALPKRAYWLIYLSGCLFWLTVLYGIGKAHWATRAFGWPVLSGYLAVYIPLFIALCRPIVHRLQVPIPIAAPLVWTALEYVRAYFVTGFSMAQLGHTQVDYLPLIQISSITGAYGVSFLVMLVASLLLMAVPPWEAGKADRAQPKPTRQVAWVVAALLVVVGSYVGGQQWLRVEQRYDAENLAQQKEAGNRPVQIGLVQGSIDTVFGDPTQSERTFEQYSQLSDLLVAEHPNLDLIVWPETTMGPHMVFEVANDFAPPPAWGSSGERAKQSILETVRGFNYFLHGLVVNRWRAPLLLGTSVIRYGNQRVDHYNAAIHVGDQGTIVTRYEKTHPVMFGEYVPFGDWFPFVYDWLPIGGGLTPGKGPIVVDVEGVNLVPCICFENTVPHLVAGQIRTLNAEGEKVDALVTLTNDGWFWGTSILDLHLTCARFRAVENRRPMLVAANTGISAAIDAQGKIGQYAPIRKTSFLVAEVTPTDRPLSFYTRFGDWFAAGCLLLTLPLVIAGVFFRRGKRETDPIPEQKPPD